MKPNLPVTTAALLLSLLIAQPAFSQTANTGANLDLPRLVLKESGLFLVLSPDGFILPGNKPYGLYQDDTRFLSNLAINIDGKPPRLISSDMKKGYYGAFLYQSGSLKIKREAVLNRALFEKLTIRNTAREPRNFQLSFDFDGDYQDMFEIRGQKRAARGEKHLTVLPDKLCFSYQGLDGLKRLTTIEIKNLPGLKMEPLKATAQIKLRGAGEITIETEIRTGYAKAAESAPLSSFEQVRKEADSDFQTFRESLRAPLMPPQMRGIYEQAVRDLYLLTQETDGMRTIAAGLPWYAVPFGRDQAITALMTSPEAPQLSKDVLLFLANHQGKKQDSYTEETPGKIMHELRSGEMARLKEIPFIPYFGTIDATPLFIVLFGRYIEKTGDTALLDKLWKNVMAAADYLMIATPDDFLYYGGKPGEALTNQAWKDSGDSISHKDGTLGQAPIAACEVQGYLFEAWKTLAKMCRQKGDEKQARIFEEKATKLSNHFEQAFYMPEEKFYALALEGSGKPCQVIASNAGHLLDSGIISQARAREIVARLMRSDLFSGWGIRTLAAGEKRYDPTSYHNGSVWPHDNALIVHGMVKRGFHKEALKIIDALFTVAQSDKEKRLPELFCGYPRGKERQPKPYKVSCSPQAWCVGSVFSLIDDRRKAGGK